MVNLIKKIKFGVLIFSFLVFVCISIYFNVSGIEFDVHSIKQLQFSWFYFILFYVVISFIPIPIAPIMFIGGFVFPFFKAVIFTLIGSFIFSSISFFMARWLGRDYYEYLGSKDKKQRRFDLLLREDPFENLLLLRMFFIIPGEVINVYAGLSRISFKDFISSTMIVLIPLIICCVGVIRGRVMDDMVSFVLSIIGLVVILIVPIIFSEKLRRGFKKII